MLLPPPAEGEGFQLAATSVAPAGKEIWKCVVYDVPSDRWEMINRVESIQNGPMHHMSIVVLALTGVSLEPGEYDCRALYEQYPDLMDGLIVYASQAAEQTIQLPDGVAANFPPNIRVMHELHYVNTTEHDEDVYSYVNAHATDPLTIRETIWGAAIRDRNLHIPARAAHDEWTRCVMTDDIDLQFMSSHTHELGTEVAVRLFDGERAGETIYVNHDWETPFVEHFEQPIHIPAGTGFEFTCSYNNPTGDPVTYGFSAKDEMCTMALVYTPGEAKRKCVPVASSDGVF